MSSFLPLSLQVRQIIGKLCEDSETLPPGYLIDQLTKMTFDSDSCTPIEEQLCEKLEKNSTNIRLKTLRIIKSVCENGSPNFKRDMQRQTSGIRSCMQWKGPPHPTLGDAVNKMVRDAAQECINAVFDTESKAAGPKISAQGFGSNSSGTEQYIAPSGGSAPSSSFSGSTSAPGSGKYAGFGNPEFQGKDRSGSLDMSSIQDAGAKAMSFMAEGLSKLKGKIDETAKQNASPTVGSSSLYQNPSTQSTFGTVSSGGGGSSTYNVGGAYRGGDSYTTPATSFGSAQGPYGSPASTTSSMTPQASGEYETKVVEAATQPTGVRAMPSRDDIKQFTSKCSTLSPSVVVPLLCQRFTSPQWQTRLKALVMLEGLISTEQGNDVICEAANYASSISENCASVQAQVKEVAMRLLPVVQGGGSALAQASTAASHSQVGDMLGGMSLSSAPAPASSSQPSAFGFLDSDPSPAVQAVQRPVAPAPAAPSSFDFLSDSVPVSQAAPSASAFNFLDAGAPQAAPASSTSAFNFLDSSAPAPAPAASNSAFSFLSEAAPAPAPAPAPLGMASGMSNKNSSFKAAPAGQTELEKMLANPSGYLPSMTARPASNAFEMEFGYGQTQQQPMQNAYMQNAYMQQQQQQQFSSVPVMQPTFDFVEDAMMKKKREAGK